MDTPPSRPPRHEVSLAGRFVGLSIIGSAVIFIIFLEGFGSPDYLPWVKWMLLGAAVAAVGVPLLFFRRRVDEYLDR